MSGDIWGLGFNMTGDFYDTKHEIGGRFYDLVQGE